MRGALGFFSRGAFDRLGCRYDSVRSMSCAARLWYKAQSMTRRGLTATILAILAVQMLGGMVLASDCLEPCPDDANGTGCPPICALCTSCTHAQTAIVQRSSAGIPLMAMRGFLAQPTASVSSQIADDIFHVPLLG